MVAFQSQRKRSGRQCVPPSGLETASRDANSRRPCVPTQGPGNRNSATNTLYIYRLIISSANTCMCSHICVYKHSLSVCLSVCVCVSVCVCSVSHQSVYLSTDLPVCLSCPVLGCPVLSGPSCLPVCLGRGGGLYIFRHLF